MAATSSTASPAAIHRCRCQIKPIPLPNGRDGYVGASIGVAIYPEHGTNSAAIMKCADDVMYVVKRSGKNNYMFVGAEAGARG